MTKEEAECVSAIQYLSKLIADAALNSLSSEKEVVMRFLCNRYLYNSERLCALKIKPVKTDYKENATKDDFKKS